MSSRNPIIATASEGEPGENHVLVADEYGKYGVSLLEDGSFCFGVEAAEFITIWGPIIYAFIS